MRKVKWWDWIPISGIFTACNNQAACPNWAVFLLWHLYQVPISSFIIFKIISLWV